MARARAGRGGRAVETDARRHVETVARASRPSVAMSDDSRGVRLEMDAYAGSAERPIRAFASTSTSASVGSEEDARSRPSSWI